MVDLTYPKPALGAGRPVRLERPAAGETPSLPGFHGLVGRSAVMRELYRELELVSATDVTVLIEGETGTGKDLIARTLHRLSPRADKPFVALNASNLQEQLFESELFGHVRGAFSGAHEDHEGLARAAAGGTLFLDEVRELSPANQARLLRFLDTREVRPVGSTRTYTVDARIVAATNRCLKEAVRAGEFRVDLYYRLRVVRVRAPALRERLEDLPLLIRHFLDKLTEEHGKRIAGLAAEARAALLAHAWHGNVRELENELERAVVMTRDGEEIRPPVLSEEVRGAGEPAPASAGCLRTYRRRVERRLIAATLKHHGWNVSAAARELGLSRVGLTKKLKRLGIERP